MTTALGAPLTVPEHARGPLRAWVGKALWPLQWADDVAATYLTLRLEIAERHSGVTLPDPQLPLLAPVAWQLAVEPVRRA